MKPVGIFGGTFDPVHFGHLRAAVEITERFDLGELRLVPCAIPPLKAAASAGSEHRVKMLQEATNGLPGIRIDDIELRRQGPSYTIDTVTAIRESLQGVTSILFMGSDAFTDLHRWHRWQALLDMTHIVVMHRPGWDIASSEIQDSLADELKQAMKQRMTEQSEDLYRQPDGRILLLPLRQFFISSSEIRQMVKNKRNIRYLLPESVRDYISKENIYC